jgi:hypothetical protein
MAFRTLPARAVRCAALAARAGRAGAAAAAVLLLGGCSIDEIVKATDPDVIDPAFVQSPSGADGIRVGTLGRFNANTVGGESMFLYGGLMADEFTTGDTFVQRNETDQRSVTPENGNLVTAYRGVHLARVGAIQARDALRAFPQPTGGNEWRLAEMFFVESYMINLLAEHFCNGQPLSTLENFQETPSGRVSTDSLYLIAQAKIDSGLALLVPTLTTANDVRVRSSLQILKARVALNQGNWTLASTAATAVPTTFVWNQEQSLTSRTPGVWSLVNNQRRYVVANNEGPLQMGFANAVQDPRVPTCAPGTVATSFNAAACTAAGFTTVDPFDSGNLQVPRMRYQLIWSTDAANVALISGLQARLYEAEAQNRLNNFAGALSTLNALRATPPTYVLPGRTIPALTNLTDPGSEAARVDLIFREKGFWLFGLGHRFGDLRRLQRQYNRTQAQTWPTGTWQLNRGTYGPDVTFPTPAPESNNRLVPQSQPGIPACIDRNP